MKMVLKISPKQYSTKYIGYGDYEYRYVSTSVFLEKLQGIDYLSSKIVSIDSCTNAFRGQGGCVNKDSLQITFKYKWQPMTRAPQSWCYVEV